MKTNKAAKTTLASSGKTSPTSGVPLHANKVLVDVDGVEVARGGEQVLQNVSFCIHAGEFVGVIGPNGAGKTTLLHVLLGLLRPQAGRVATGVKRIGYIPQRASFYQSQVPISVKEVVQLGGPQFQAALQEVGVANLAGRRFAELSGGQQQRVLIAKALAANPDLLILDEPTTGIDERAQTDFYQTLQTLQSKGLTIIMVSHDVDAVLQLVTRVICLNGSILYDGPPEHFEADEYLPKFYTAQHQLLHHKHGVPHA